MRKLYWRLMNWWRGFSFWYDEEGVMQFSEGTCPYPVHPDWSAAGCIKRGTCGCDERDKA